MQRTSKKLMLIIYTKAKYQAADSILRRNSNRNKPQAIQEGAAVLALAHSNLATWTISFYTFSFFYLSATARCASGATQVVVRVVASLVVSSHARPAFRVVLRDGGEAKSKYQGLLNKSTTVSACVASPHHVSDHFTSLFETLVHGCSFMLGWIFLYVVEVFLMNCRPRALALQPLKNWIRSEQEVGFTI